MSGLKYIIVAAGALAAAVTFTPGAHAQASPDNAAPGPQLRSQTQANDGPSPITLRLQYSGEVGENAIGGLKQGATYMNNVLGQLRVDTDKAFGWTGGSFVLEGFYENADSLDTQYVGSAQDPSVIDTSGTAKFRLYQAYYKQNFGDTNLLLGIYDLETAFGITRPMDVFFNGAFAWTTTLDQSGRNGPSTYPDTALTLRIEHRFNEQWSVQAAIADGVPDSPRYPASNAVNINSGNGALAIAEVDYAPVRGTKLMAGYWYYTGKFDSLEGVRANGDPLQVHGAGGAYVGGATRLYSQTARRGLDGFINIGIGPNRVQQIDRSLNLGLVYTGLLDARPTDRLGAAIGIAGAGDPYKRMVRASGSGVESYETVLELTYRARLTDWLAVQPDVQYFVNPNMDPALKNDLLLLLHFEVSHVFGL